MVYLLIGGILLLIVAPIIRILPSRRQKEQMALRRTASSNGLTVELTHIDDPDPDPEKYLSNTGRPLPRVMAVIAYRKPVKKPAEWRRIPAVDWCVVRRQGGKATGLPEGWDWDVPLPAHANTKLASFVVGALTTLPDDAVKVEERSWIVSVYWNERGGVEGLNAIIDFSKTVSDIEASVVIADTDNDPSDDDRS
ncbi:MAG: hypothetical protein KDI19_09045 [Pseudomonadales bacterium]|nr:hypothetical protein [Pseudomonadales bacterium]